MNDIFSHTLISYHDHRITLGTLSILLLFLFVLFVILKILKKLIYSYARIDVAKKYSIYTLLKYFLLVIGAVVALQIIGFDVSILLAGSAALLVGLGLGVQNLFSDYVSGIILLMDSTVKVGDVIDINGIVGRVEEINLRTTIVTTRDEKYIIIPNTELTRNSLINWTLSEVEARFDVTVGVGYGSDIELVKRLLIESAKSHQNVLQSPVPFVRFNDHADSSLVFSVYFWTNEVYRVENIKSDIREQITLRFRANGVEIPFPQRVIHQSE